MFANVGGGVVDGLLFDSFEIEPRVLFCVRFGASAEPIFDVIFLSSSFSSLGVCGRVFDDGCGVDALAKDVRNEQLINLSIFHQNCPKSHQCISTLSTSATTTTGY